MLPIFSPSAFAPYFLLWQFQVLLPLGNVLIYFDIISPNWGTAACATFRQHRVE